MRFVRPLRIDLRRLILLLALVSALLALASALHASYRVQRQQLIDSTLESNRVYAAKLAESTEAFLHASMQQLGYSARVAGRRFDEAHVLEEEARRLKQQGNTFNTVVIVDARGQVLSTSPELPTIIGSLLHSVGNRDALLARQPLVSQPYVSATGNLVVSLSHPMHDEGGRYLGYIAGTIYLQKENVLQTLLGRHYYRDGSYLYVVDRDGRLIYHHDRRRAGERVQGNHVIDAVRRGGQGAMAVRNSHGVHMLAGYAPVPFAGWGVIAQRPTASTLAQMGELMRDVLWRTIPLAILLLAGIWWCARQISLPLWQLARNATLPDTDRAIDEVTAVSAWYFEVANLKQAVLSSFGTLQEKIGRLGLATMTDPMTNLRNRRGMQHAVDQWQRAARGFAVVTLDIDHFKAINDGHGHASGDDVIKTVAQLMREASRDVDVACRSGGEEFQLLLPDTDAASAAQVAERLRQRVEAHTFTVPVTVTISLGIAVHPAADPDTDSTFEHADAALYAAKRGGRNRVEVWSGSAE